MTADVAALEKLHYAYYAAWEDGDVATMLRIWLDSDDVVIVQPGVPPRYGRAAVEHALELAVEMTAGAQFLFEDVDVRLVGDVGRVTCVENVVAPQTLNLEDYTDFEASRLATVNHFWRTPAGWRLWTHQAGPIIDLYSETIR